MLFGGESPKIRNPGKYSFAWQGQFIGEDSSLFMLSTFESADLPELFARLDSAQFDSFKGLGQNALMADTSGNIGYRLIMTVPERKDKTPYLAARILNGQSSKFDWTGEIVPIRDLPKSLNPAKGYLATANGRMTSDHVVHDIGAHVNCPVRILRIDELLRDGIASGKKFTLADMGAIQQDVVDVVARRVTPKIVEISQSAAQELSAE